MTVLPPSAQRADASSANMTVLPPSAQRVDASSAKTCMSAAPLLVPILASRYASGSFSWSSPSCPAASGSWTATALGGSFTYATGLAGGTITGTWTTSTAGGSFSYSACTYCDQSNGTWTNTSTGGTFSYVCFACGQVLGSWDAFSGGGGEFHYGCSGCADWYGYWTSNTQAGGMTMVCSSCDTTSIGWTWSGAMATPAPSSTPSPTATPMPASTQSPMASPTPSPLVAPVPSPTPSVIPSPSPSPGPSATCTSSVGPGIPPPQGPLTEGIDGLHAAWYGQSGYPTLCPGDKTTVTVAYLNTGSIGWVAGAPGDTALLGTWDPIPGQDMPSLLGGDGTHGSPATGWASYDRPAAQPAAYVGPGQVAWFQFTVQAPSTAGTYELALRPVIEGTTWLEDYGVFVYVTVSSPAGP